MIKHTNQPTETDAPVLRGVLIRPGQIKVYCPNCNDYHLHGWPPGTADDALEHRRPHCFHPHRINGMFAETGYHIALEVKR
jgi:hypothetical protein